MHTSVSTPSPSFPVSAITAAATALALLAAGGSAIAQEAPANDAGGASALWRDATAGYMFRSSSFHRSSNGNTEANNAGRFKQAGAGLGGWFYANSGEVAETLSFGATYNWVQPLWSPDANFNNFILRDKSSNGVVFDGQGGYGVVGEANARLRFGTNTVVLGRQTIRNQWFMDGVYRFFNKLDQGMIGPRDIRGMNWLTYEAATLQGRALDESLRYYGGYVTGIKQVNDDRFRNLVHGAWDVFRPGPQRTGDSDGMAYVGAQWKPMENAMVSTSYNHVDNLMNMFYLDYDHVFRMEGTQYLRVGTQWLYQEANGQSIPTQGRNFHTNMGGLYLEARPVEWWIPYATAGKTSENNRIYSLFSLGPSYLIQRIGENSLAGERTWILGSVFDFGSLGVKGLSFDVTYGERRSRKVDGNSGLPLPDYDEVATDLIYVLPFEGFFKNMRARARWAKNWEDGLSGASGSLVRVDQSTNDVRFDVQLNIPFR